MSISYYQSAKGVKQYIDMVDSPNEDILRKFSTYLKPQSHVLELGSGAGFDWDWLSRRYRVTGSDISEEFLAHLQKTYPRGEFLLLDACSLKISLRFHGVYASKVFHHFDDAQLLLAIDQVYEVLIPEGIACLTFWRGVGVEFYHDMLVNYHTEEELQKLFSDRFEILLLSRYDEFESGDSLLLIARRK